MKRVTKWIWIQFLIFYRSCAGFFFDLKCGVIFFIKSYFNYLAQIHIKFWQIFVSLFNGDSDIIKISLKQSALVEKILLIPLLFSCISLVCMQLCIEFSWFHTSQNRCFIFIVIVIVLLPTIDVILSIHNEINW